jgi:hypothetical protein
MEWAVTARPMGPCGPAECVRRRPGCRCSCGGTYRGGGPRQRTPAGVGGNGRREGVKQPAHESRERGSVTVQGDVLRLPMAGRRQKPARARDAGRAQQPPAFLGWLSRCLPVRHGTLLTGPRAGPRRNPRPRAQRTAGGQVPTSDHTHPTDPLSHEPGLTRQTP